MRLAEKILIEMSENKELKELSDFLKSLQSKLSDARSEVKKGEVGRNVSDLVGTMVGVGREKWYRELFK